MLTAKMRVRALISAALCAVFAASAMADTWFVASPEGGVVADPQAVPQDPRVSVGFHNETDLELAVDTAGFALKAGQSLSEDGSGLVLPVVHRLFVAPRDATISLNVSEGQAVSVDLQALDLVAPVVSTPAERVTVTRLGAVRGWDLCELVVHPMAYDGTGATLLLWPHIEVLITFEGSSGPPVGEGSLAPLNRVLLNPQPTHLNGRGSGNYLIVTASDYAGSAPLTQLVDHRTAAGFTVSVYTVPSGTSRTAIKSYIQSLWGTADAPDYILLVGDTDGSSSTSSTIPHWVGGGSKTAPTDLPYACMDAGDDWYPDMAIGRLSVRSVGTLQDVVDKILTVENGDYPDPAYVRRAAWLANGDLSCGAQETHDYVISTYFDPAGFDSIRIYESAGGNTADVTNAVNQGVLFVVYGGHSSSDGWWGPTFYKSNVEALSNAGMYPFVFGWSCNTANFVYDECFGETWLRVANRGAAAYVSASTYTYYGSWDTWEPNRRLEKYLFDAMFGNQIWEVGPALHAAFYQLLADPDYGPSNPITRNMLEMFVLLGDPALLLPGPCQFLSTDTYTGQTRRRMGGRD